jgi:hypothetical protein
MRNSILFFISLFIISCVTPSHLGVRYRGEKIINSSDRITNNPNIIISVNPLTSEDIPYDIDILRNKFETYVHKNAELEGLIKKYPGLKINMEVTPSKKIQRTMIWDILFFFPCEGWALPYTPWWGTINLDSKLTISVPKKMSNDFKFSAEEPFEINSYPYYKAGKIFTIKFSVAYENIFEQVSTYNFTEFATKVNNMKTDVSAYQQDSVNALLNAKNRAKTLATVYARSYFQSRFMNLTATMLDAIVPIANGVSNGLSHNNNALVKNEDKENLQADIIAQRERKNNNEFEMKLGDFDLLSYFDSSFYSLNGSIKDFSLDITANKTAHSNIIKRLNTYYNDKLDEQFTTELNSSNYKFISAFKFQYGIGARVGGEQFRLTKLYQPFVRVVGMIRDVKTNKIVWSNNIIVFSNLIYHGQKAAKEANMTELKEEFKAISDKLARIIVDDINGKRYTYLEYLVDYNPGIDDAL